ncbi:MULTISPECIES: RIP metalloprotease RseP [unclassified Xanthobacter]|uniref:RIP metalloprotease RseP n=1 Tax=Xanthobacter TaxID=279 RepID=UPI00145ED672|nr:MULTISPECIES: RIP metalloprotease RseP [unclassified Xanthobacter]UJX47867.1 RIP metalloprotease RseP [Xanthobacter sp. YC-JY1]
MDVISGLGANLGTLSSTLLGYVIPFLFVLTLVVFFHELGHFWVARRAGVRVVTFSLGFGPEIAGFNDKHGTRWRIAAIPLGGYVRFFGDEDAASTPDSARLSQMTAAERNESFFYKPVAWRAAIVAAGPIANFLLAIAIFAIVFMVFGKQVTAPRVDQINPGSAAEMAGFKPGDLVLEIDGAKVDSFSDMQRIVGSHAGQPLAFTVARGDREVTLTATPELKEVKDPFGNSHRTGLLGISRSLAAGDVTTQRFGPVEAIGMGVQETWFVVARTFDYLGGLVAGRESADQLGGPIRIAQVSGQVATFGIGALLSLAAVLSVSIGLLNLFPIPLLDGGHLLFYAFEAIRGRPLSARTQDIGFRIGLALVLMLMIFATWNDVLHIAAM